ncbi:MAG: hypothetical protein PHN95_00490 [Candidatus Pacebacteria bacterium]|jgi:hypothetical protein|nr:hypothetical protein [Candidatus Paceibacterota bacterium]MDD4998904.1 hypothetical protein [Candidatus Paceibacterota bacterium]
MIVVLLVGCNGVTPPLPDGMPEIPIDLIKEYTKYDVVTRWADGEVVSVYDETNYERMQEILNKINGAIDGPVVFQLSNEPNSKIKVIFKEQEGSLSYVRLEWNDAHELTNILIEINPLIEDPQVVYLQYEQAFLVSLNINLSKSYQGLTPEIAEVLFWLYRLEPGYPLTLT